MNNSSDLPTMRSALDEAINKKLNVVLRYGRGSKPGRVRTVKALTFIDEDLIEGIQISPEKREYSQNYRISCILDCEIDGRLYTNIFAREKCRNYIEYYEKSEELSASVLLIEAGIEVRLPSNLTKIGTNDYIWRYKSGKPGVRLTAKRNQDVAAFIKIANAVAIEDWGGRVWVFIDAMFKYQISWPGWYAYGAHLYKKINEANLDGINLKLTDWEFSVSELDWPGSNLFLDPISIASHQKSLTPLYASLHHIPNDIKLAYIHNSRPKIEKYNYSQLLAGDFNSEEMIIKLYELGLADGSMEKIIETTSINAMRAALEHANICLPENERAREPHVNLIISHPELNDVFKKQLWKYRRSIFLKAPDPLTWEEFHELRAQIILMGKLFYQYLSGETSYSPLAEKLLSGTA